MSPSSTISVMPSATTVYSLVSVSDARCAGVATGTARVTVYPRPQAVLSGSTLVCDQSPATLTVSLTGTAPWTIIYAVGAAQQSISNITASPYQFVVTPAATTVYRLVDVSDAYCSGSVSGQATVVVATTVSPIFTPIPALCQHSIAPVLPTLSNNNIRGRWNPAFIDTSVAGVQSYTFTPDMGQCASPTTINIEVNPAISFISTVVRHSTAGQSNGSVTLAISGGTPPYSYAVGLAGAPRPVAYQPSPVFSGLISGDYIAYVVDSKGCMGQKDFLIGVAIGITATESSGCFGTIISVPVSATGFTEVLSFTLQIKYDNTLISYNSVGATHPALANGPIVASEPVPGTIRLRYDSNVGPVTLPGDARLFEIRFTGLAPGTTSFDWDESFCIFISTAVVRNPQIVVPGKITINPLPKVENVSLTSYCEGDRLILRASSPDNSASSWLWSGPSGNYTGADWDLGNLDLNDSGIYTLQALNKFGCRTEVNFNLSVHPKPQIEISVTERPGVWLYDGDTLYITDPVHLDAGAGYEWYIWRKNNYISSIDQIVVINSAGPIHLELANTFGCTNDATVHIYAYTDDKLILVNAFSPDDDGINDTWAPLKNDISVKDPVMEIYNRWGGRVRTVRGGRDTGWDGKLEDGRDAPAGIYIYTIEFTTPLQVRVKLPPKVVMLVR